MFKDVVQYDQREQWAVVRLNRPEVHNAVNDVVMERLEEIQAILQSRPEIRVVILTGSGDESFCAGGDIRYFASLRTRDAALAMSRRMQAILTKFKEGDRVVVAAVNGNALGGGCEILTACHYRIAVDHARFSFRQAANGIITGWGGGVRLFKQIAPSDALRLLATSATFDAQQALAMRFINQVVSSGNALTTACDLAAQISRHSAAAVRAFVRIGHRVEKGDIDVAVAFETEQFGDLWVSDEFKEWLTAFLKNSSSK